MKSRISKSLRPLFSPERLEDRRCFNVDLSLLSGGTTLLITGDSLSNHVAIEETVEGFQVRVEDQPFRSFVNVENILFDGRDGNDVLSFSWGMHHPINLQARMGGGEDTFRASVENQSDGALPPGPCRMFVSGGAGNDNINALIGLLRNERALPGQVDFNFEGGDGNDTTGFSWGAGVATNVFGKLGAGDDSFQANVAWFGQGGGSGFGDGGGAGFGDGGGAGLPGPCRLTILGEGGNDSINALIGLLNTETPAVDLNAPVNIQFDGGEGSDSLNSTFRNVRMNGPVSVDMRGGAGNDTLSGLFDKASQTNAFDLHLDGGIGDDILNLLAARSADGVVPEVNLKVLGRSHISLEGNAGNDRVIGQLAPSVSPSGNLEIVFAGGQGSDIVTMLLSPERVEGEEGNLFASVLGGDGNDLMAMIIKNQETARSNRRYLLDGGEGFDSYYAGPLVTVSNAEKKLG